jgi:transcriptional regulator with XRE-family HTH domain
MRIGLQWRLGEIGRMDFPDLIRTILKRQEWTQGRLAEELSASQASVSRYLSGAQKPEFETGTAIIQLAKRLGILFDESVAPQGTMVASITGIVGLGEVIEWIGDSDMSLGEVELPFPVKQGCVALEARGDSQFPRVKNGEILIVYFNGRTAADMIGEEAVVRLRDGTYLMKTIRRGYEPGLFNLESHNAPTRENVEIDQVASVVAIIPSGQWRGFPK